MKDIGSLELPKNKQPSADIKDVPSDDKSETSDAPKSKLPGPSEKYSPAMVSSIQGVEEVESKPLEPLTLDRPPLWEETKSSIRDMAPKTPDGKFLDPHRPGKTIDGPWDYGHKYGHENRRLVLEAKEKGMTQQQFNHWVNSHPEWFQIESHADNISHKFEKPGLN